jgi:hypothetical protein
MGVRHGSFAAHNEAPFGGSAREETMTGAMAAVGIAVGGTTLICYALMVRLQNSRRKRQSSGDRFRLVTPLGPTAAILSPATAGASSPGSAEIIPSSTVPAIRLIPAEAIAGEAVIAAEEATSVARHRKSSRILI